MSVKNRILAVCIVFVLSLIIFISCIPIILSSHFAKNWLLSTVSKNIKGSIQVESISLSWFGPQKITDLRLWDPDGKKIVSLQSLDTDTPLFAFFSRNLSLNDTRLEALNAEIGGSLLNSLGMSAYSPTIKDPNTLKLSNTDLMLNGSASSFIIQASGNTHLDGKNGSFSLDCVVSDQESRIKANVIDFPVEILDVLAALNHPEHYGLMTRLLGSTLNIKINESTDSGATHLVANFESSRLRLDMEGQIVDKVFELDSPALVNILLNPLAFDALIALSDNSSSLKLLKPVRVNLQLNAAKIPLDFLQSNLIYEAARQMVLKLNLGFPVFEWESDGQKNLIKDFQFEVNALPGDSNANVLMSGFFQNEGKALPFELKSLHHKPLNIQDILTSIVQPQEMNFSLNQIKTKSLDSFFATGDHWQKIFGETLSIRMFSQNSDLQTLNASLISDKIDIPRLKLVIDQQIILNHLQKPISGRVYADEIFFKKQKSSLKDFGIDWKANLASRNITASFSGKTEFSGIEIDGQLKGHVFLDAKETHNPTLRTDLNGTHIPAPFLSLVSGRKEWESVFGSVVDLHIKAHMQDLSGPIKAQISGKNGKLAFDGQLTKRLLTLNSPLHLSAKATENLGNDVLSDFAPVFAQLVSAENTISLDIDPDQFSMPLDLNFLEMNFKHAVLNFGKMTFRNGGDVRRLLNVLKTDSPSLVDVWATPMHIKMDQGVLTIYRMDMLILNRFPIATWGKIHLVNDKVNMVLGLSQVALSQSLGVTGIPKNYMLQIPIKGSTTNTKIDSGKVMGRIGALIAQSSGGPEGFVLGTVLDLANGKDPKIPAPTTNPLPWGDLSVTEVNKEKKSNKNNPVDGIRKEASKLLKDIFK